ncbi:MAG TPA: SRPBCC family protein [Candidatus Limnocylindrales bacterium]|nr:SRPBCC family protein [Candidatus Limnocylindrales bacterium]
MLRALLRLAAVGALGATAAVASDAFLRRRRGSAPLEPLRMLVVVDAPIDRTWAVVADVPRQPEWMHEMRAVTFLDPLPLRVGSRAEATVRILGISVTDPVVVTDITPPTRYAIRHEGRFLGDGMITLEAGATGETTIVRWEETLIPPLLPDLGAVLQAPILRAIFQADLARLKALVEQDLARDAAAEPARPSEPDARVASAPR